MLILQEYEAQMNEMKNAFELEKSNKTKLEKDMLKLRAFYDGKLQEVDGQLADLPSTAEGGDLLTYLLVVSILIHFHNLYFETQKMPLIIMCGLGNFF